MDIKMVKKKTYCINWNKNRKLKNPTISYFFNETVVFLSFAMKKF